MKINYNEYMYEVIYCDIISDECCGLDCRSCEIAKKEIKRNKIEEIKNYQNLNIERFIGNLKVKGNEDNTIIKDDIENINKFIEFFEDSFDKKHYKKIFNEFEIPLTKYPEYVKLKLINNLPYPDYFMFLKNQPLIAVYSDIIYIIAPIIEQEDLE